MTYENKIDTSSLQYLMDEAKKDIPGVSHAVIHSLVERGIRFGKSKGYHEGQESAFRKVVELIREVSTQEQDIFSKNDYVRYLLANKEKILTRE